MRDVLWEPNPGPQTEFSQSSADYVLYGGARGGGKTDSLLAEATRWGDYPDYKALFLRRTFPQLTEVLERAHRMYPQLGWKWEGEKRLWRSPSGAFVRFGHCQHETDKYQYIGSEFHRILYDQVERFTETQFTEINTTLRSTNPEIPTQILASANPGGIGHTWVQLKWIKRCPPVARGERVHNEHFGIDWQPMQRGEVYTDEYGETWEYHPAFVFDNPQLMEGDPKYVRKLLALPYEQKEAYLWGNWDVFVGQYFGEFRPEIHVIPSGELAKIPRTWDIYAGCDYATTGWYFSLVVAVDHDGNVWVIDEDYFYGKSLKYKARRAKRLCEKYRIKKWFCPFDMYRKRNDREEASSETIVDRFRHYLGYDVSVAKAPKDRIQGWDTIKEGLSWGDGDVPWLRIRDNCKKLIETIPAQVHDESNPEDLDTDGWDHAVDCLRYIVMGLNREPKDFVRLDAYDRALRERKRQRGPLSWLLN